MTKTAIITGITGQDGSYLAELLLNKGYGVVGLYRRSSINNFERINHLTSHPRLILEEFDITDPSDCLSVITKHRPSELYNLAAQSHVATSFKQPTTTFEINTIGVTNLLESIRKYSSTTKFYQASTSEMFGRNYQTNMIMGDFQNEQTAFLPQSPYAIAKLASHRMVQIYRSAYQIYACSGILFNHESPRRGENFLTRKVTSYIGKLINGLIPHNTKLKLGNLDSYRDWGHARDYVSAMYLMLQQSKPDDFVISSGETHSVKEFVIKAFELVNLNWENYVAIDHELYRPSEVAYLKGDSSKAKTQLKWNTSVSFNELIKDMINSDIEKYKYAKKF
jgi:GDPmannose 4,6-dehydratase